MKKAKKEGNRTVVVIFVVLILAIVFKFFIFNSVVDDESILCNPGLFCLDDRLAYKSLTCGVLVNPDQESNEVCEGGRFVQESDFYERVVWDQNVPTIVIRDIEGGIFEWEYFEPGEVSEDVSLSPGAEPVGLVSLEGAFGKQDGVVYMYIP